MTRNQGDPAGALIIWPKVAARRGRNRPHALPLAFALTLSRK